MTNYERIKNMSIKDMAEFLNFDSRPYCTLDKSYCVCGWHERDCTAHAKYWLNSEVDEK